MIELQKVIGVIVAGILVNAFFMFPDILWYMLIQTILFSTILYVLSPTLAKYYDMFKIIVKEPLYIVPVTLLLVLLINFIKYLFGSEIFDSEIFNSEHRDENYEHFNSIDTKLIDTDTEPQHSYEHRMMSNDDNCDIRDNLNILTEETKLNDIDVALQETHTEIDKIIKYLQTNQPDERWLSKKQMDDPAQKLFF